MISASLKSPLQRRHLLRLSGNLSSSEVCELAPPLSHRLEPAGFTHTPTIPVPQLTLTHIQKDLKSQCQYSNWMDCIAS
jgi:hypothetical protein